MLWCSLGNTAPYHITQPSTDNDVQIVSPTTTMATLMCSLNVTIPSSAIVSWTHDTNPIPNNQSSTAGSTTTLTIESLQSSDAGVYQCMFNDAIGSGWVLRRNIILLITGMFVAIYMKLWTTYIYIANYMQLANYGLPTMCFWIAISLNTHL